MNKKNKSKLEISKHLHLFRGFLCDLKAPSLVSGFGNTRHFSLHVCLMYIFIACAVEIMDLDMRVYGLRYEVHMKRNVFMCISRGYDP